jgi:DNA primase
MIGQDVIDSILDRVDIVEVISGYIPLKQNGKNFKALCPFHHEKTPSFIVSPDKQIFHCFGCGAGGNAIGFVMKYDKVEFQEAIRTLAKRAGLDVPWESKERASLIERIYETNEMAASFYVSSLWDKANGRKAMEYLRGRKVSQECIRTFKLGFAPDGWDSLLVFARSKGIAEGMLVKSGLAIERSEGGYYDRFRNRIVFPVFSVQSKVVGFGARVLDESEPKYINSPETEAYVKRRILYGLNLSSAAIREKDVAIIVEGYLDLITLYGGGITNVVATLGTALSADHLRLLKRYTNNVVILFDADEAGKGASVRGLDLFLEEGLNVRVACLPRGFDPDSFLLKYGKAEFEKLISDSKHLFEYKLSALMEKYDSRDVQQKASIVSGMLATVSKVNNEVIKSEYVKRLSERLNIREESLFAELRKSKTGQFSYRSGQQDRKDKLDNVHPSEMMLVGLLLENVQAAEKVRNLCVSDLENETVIRIVNEICQLISQDKPVVAGKLAGRFADDAASRVITCALMEVRFVGDKDKALMDCVRKIRVRCLKRRENEIKSRMLRAVPDEKVRLGEECRKLRVEMEKYLR